MSTNIPIFSIRWNRTVCQIIFINWEEIISDDKSHFWSNLLNRDGRKASVHQGRFIAVLICQSNPVKASARPELLTGGDQNKKIKYLSVMMMISFIPSRLFVFPSLSSVLCLYYYLPLSSTSSLSGQFHGMIMMRLLWFL